MTAIEIPALSIPKVALVTGGNSGIGKATAARLAALGSAVVVGYNSRRAQAEQVVEGLQGRGQIGIGYFLDKVGKGLGNLLLHIERFLQIADVEGL